MKKIILLLYLAFPWSMFSQQYVPFLTENEEWNVRYTTTPEDFPGAHSTRLLKYTLRGDTMIDNVTYKRVCLIVGTPENPVYVGVGGLRESNKQIFYVGQGYIRDASATNQQRIKKTTECGFSTVSSNSGYETLLYDFNAQEGDLVQWGYENGTIEKIDSILIGHSYRKTYRFKYTNDLVIEGIGNVTSGLFGWVTPIPMCGGGFEFEHICFSQNGEALYFNPTYVDCNSTEKWDDKKYFTQGDRWTQYNIITYLYPQYYSRINSKNQYFLGADTLIAGKNYHNIIENTPNDLHHPQKHYGGVREENGKVYVNFGDNSTEEFVLYDYTLKVGDSLHLKLNMYPLRPYPTVSRIDTIQLLNGEKRKVFRFNSFSYIEGIGNPAGIFNYQLDVCTCDPFYTTSLACFKTSSEELYKDSYWCADGNCCGVLVGMNEIQADEVQSTLFPNPAFDFTKLTITNSKGPCTSVEIMDFQGRKINTIPSSLGANDIDIDLSTYRAGIYFVMVRYADRSESHKLIKL